MVGFYNNFIRLCNLADKSPSRVAIEIGTSKPSVTRWKNGSMPSDATIQKIADYFEVSVSALTSNDSHLNNDSHPNENILRIAGRDGRQIEKRLTDEQVKALEAIINQLPDAPDDL